MPRILHVSDTHLGARPRERVERERDIYEVFKEIVDIAVERSVDAVIHGGDFFDTPHPFPTPYIVAMEQLARLRSRGIEVYTVPGNHDAPKPRRNSPLELLEKLGLVRVVASWENPELPGRALLVSRDGVEVEIHGYPSTAVESLRRGSPAEGRGARILLAHVAICDAWSARYGRPREICRDSGGGWRALAAASQLPRGFSYYALGDLHRSWEEVVHGAPAVYPGSPEALKRDEAAEERYVYLVEIDRDGASYKRIVLGKPRRWFFVDARGAGELLQKISSLEGELSRLGLEKPPILVVSVRSRLERHEKERITRQLDLLVREKKILYYEGPEVYGQEPEAPGELLQARGAISVDKAVEEIFRDEGVRGFVLGKVIRGGEPEEILDALLRNRDLANRILSEPVVKSLARPAGRLS